MSRFDKLVNILTKPLVLALFSGLLLTLSYRVAMLWPVALVALVPLFFSLARTQKVREAWLSSFVAHALFMGNVFAFLLAVFPLSWAGIDSEAASLVLIAVIWILSTLAFALPMSFWGVVVSRALKQPSLGGAVLVSSLWVTLEFLGALLFLLVHSGSESFLSAGWTFGHLGYVLADFPPLLALASLGGVYLLSFFLVLSNYALFLFIKNHDRREWGMKAILALPVVLTLVSVTLYTTNDTPEDQKHVSIVSVFTNFEPKFFETEDVAENSAREMDNVVRSIRESGEDPNVILFPENTEYMSRLSETQRTYVLDSLSEEGEVVVIDTERIDRDYPSLDSSRLTFYDSHSNELVRYQKLLLVPQGEYLSHFAYLLGNAVLEDDWSKGFEERRALEAGSGMVLGEAGDVTFATLFCSEVISPFLYQSASKQGAEVLLNSASHAIFGVSENLQNQILKFARVRAVENNRFYVQAGNVIPSLVVSNRGHIVNTVQSESSETLYASVPALDNTTPYARLGYAVPILFIILTIILSTGGVVSRKRGGI